MKFDMHMVFSLLIIPWEYLSLKVIKFSTVILKAERYLIYLNGDIFDAQYISGNNNVSNPQIVYYFM